MVGDWKEIAEKLAKKRFVNIGLSYYIHVNTQTKETV